jgi:transcriptional regulator with XRE-family HTH domain
MRYMATSHTAEMRMTVRGRDPLVQRRRLRLELRRLRESARQTQQEVADALEWSLSKLTRIEAGTVKISISDLRALLAHFQVADAGHIDLLLAAARDSRMPPWWNEYRDVLRGEFQKFLSFESTASVIREYCPNLVPGLFQTEPYVRALAECAAEEDPVLKSEQVDRWVRARLRRQELLMQEDPPEIRLVLGEAAIRQMIAGPAIMAEQLGHLRELADRPGMILQILGLDTGPHNGLWGPFTVHELIDSGESETIIFLESAGSDLLIRDDQEQTKRFLHRFEQLTRLAHTPDTTKHLLDEAIRRLR